MKKALPFALGALGGGLAAWAVWSFAKSKLEASFAAGQADLQRQLTAGGSELTAQFTTAERQAAATVLNLVHAQVGPAVDGAIVTTLSSYGITPSVGQKLAAIVARLP